MLDQTTTSPKQMSAYVRVSRVMGREGESYISPSVQEDAIRKWAEGRGVEIIAVDKDEDQSGGTQDRPALRTAIARIESGESDGIVVAKLNRFARNVAGAHDDIKRIQAAGGTVAFVEEGIDPTGPFGNFLLTILLAVAALELDNMKSGWEVAKNLAMERGVKIGPTPFGYVRADDATLAPHPEYGPVVTQAFTIAAAQTLPAATAYLEEHAPGERSWTTSTVRRMLAKQVYLGHLVYGEQVYTDTHEALVTPARFELANRHGATARLPKAEYPLSGFAVCAGCGASMVGAGTGTRTGTMRTYRCPKTYSKSDRCPAGANITSAVLEDHVRKLCDERGVVVPLQHGTVSATAVEVSEAEEAAQTLLTAQKTYDDYLAETELQALMGAARYFEGLRQRKEAVDTAQVAYDAVAEMPGTAPERREAWLPIGGLFDMAEAEMVPNEVPWTFVKSAITRLTVEKGRGKVAGRVKVDWATGGVSLSPEARRTVDVDRVEIAPN